MVNTKQLRSLSLVDCRLNKASAESLGNGLSKNTTLKHLDISDNKFTADSFKIWPQKCQKGLRTLRVLDVSKNSMLGPSDVHNLLHCFKN